MQNILLIFRKFHRIFYAVLILLSLLQVADIYWFDFVLTNNEDRQFLSETGVVLLFSVLFLFPFLAFRNYAPESSEKSSLSPWQFGFIINLPIVILGFLLGILDLVIKAIWVSGNYWSTHWVFYLISSLLGCLLYIVLGGFASWLASFLPRSHHKG